MILISITIVNKHFQESTNQEKNKWRLGKIEKLIAGNNGIMRGAEVKVAEQIKKPTVIMRPLQKPFLLEMKEN